jgi:hypothetical protein
VYCLRVNAQSKVIKINQCTLMFEGTLVFIEIKEQLRLFLYMRESVVDERGLGRTDIPGSTTANLGHSILYGRHDIGEAPGARSSLVSCVMFLKSRVLPR